MEKTSALLLFFLHFFSLQLFCSAYTRPSEYFINCGSDSNLTLSQRNFIGDSNSRNSHSFTLSGQSIPVKNSENLTDSSELLYQTARIFKEKSSYEFKISTSGTYLVRFHFFSFTSDTNTNLSLAVFDVSVSGYSLLSNFTMQNSKNRIRKNPLIKEFYINISTIGKFIVQFFPQNSSFAFVNAIEVFLGPENFIPDEAIYIRSVRSSSNFQGILSKALQTVYRINVGGSTVTANNDTLWRNWIPDDDYIYNSKTAKTIVHAQKPNYRDGIINEYFAPDYVYQTAKEMNVSGNSLSDNFNITWSFNVSKNARHFVRVHFCDIIGQTIGMIKFNLYINSNYSTEIYPTETIDELASPFYIDFVVDSDDSGVMNISVGPRGDSDQKTAFLNGLEMMEMMGESDLVLESHHQAKKIPILVIVGSAVGALALICILAVFICLCLRCRESKTAENSEWVLPVAVNRPESSHDRMPEGSVTSARVPDLHLKLKISFAEIMFATKNFDSRMIIGKGGFGNVYKGTLRDGMKVAVKRSKPGSGQGLQEFQTEIMVLSKIRHRHLVSLIAYCDDMSEMILVYEFMEKGSLKDHLYNSSFPPLTWRQRLEICIGAANGLHYLHRGNSGGFIHRDVKSTNILLDENLVAKVADFGLSRLGPPDQTHVSTGVKGTFGYLDPDYFRTQQLTDKSDVYSFGVVLLEALCARPAIDLSLPRDEVNLAEWVLFCKSKGTLEKVVDPSIKDQINPNSLRKFTEIAEKCLQEYGSDRPSMGDVLWDLEYSLQLQQTGVRREPHEYSASATDDASAMLCLPNIQRIPSLSFSIENDDTPILREHSSNMWASEVFSQLRLDDAR